MCRSRRELSNAYLLVKIGVDTAENEPLEVWGENSIQYSLHSLNLRVQWMALRPTQACVVRRGKELLNPRFLILRLQSYRIHWAPRASRLNVERRSSLNSAERSESTTHTRRSAADFQSETIFHKILQGRSPGLGQRYKTRVLLFRKIIDWRVSRNIW